MVLVEQYRYAGGDFFLEIPTGKIEESDRDSVLEFLEHREWGVALEHFCAAVYEEKIHLEESVLRQIKDVSIKMGIWKEIRKQLIDLFQ